jgi:hypothetical protein
MVEAREEYKVRIRTCPAPDTATRYQGILHVLLAIDERLRLEEREDAKEQANEVDAGENACDG